MATRNSWQDRAVLKTTYQFTVKLDKNQTSKNETSKWLLTMHKMSCSSNIVSMLTKGIQGVALLDLTAGRYSDPKLGAESTIAPPWSDQEPHAVGLQR